MQLSPTPTQLSPIPLILLFPVTARSINALRDDMFQVAIGVVTHVAGENAFCKTSFKAYWSSKPHVYV